MFTKTTFCLLLCTILPCVGLGRSVIAAEPTFVPSIQPQLKNFRALDGARSHREWDEAPYGQAALGAVAFSVSGDNMASKGNETVVTYKTTHTNTHPEAWIAGGSHFRAPVAGVYLFTLSFTNENSHASVGDDVYVVIRKNGQSKGFAFAGAVNLQDSKQRQEMSRTTAGYTVSMNLAKDDVIHTGVVDDMKRARFIRFFNLTGVLIQATSR